jgi:sulfite reductase alpha subunit-like flavoprotein
MSTVAAAGKPVYNVKNPFIAKVKKAHDISGPGAPKNTRHYEIDLEGGELEYLPGDSLAVQPTNDPALVEDTLRGARFFNGEEIVKHPKTRCRSAHPSGFARSHAHHGDRQQTHQGHHRENRRQHAR